MTPARTPHSRATWSWGDGVAIDEGTFGGTWSPDGQFFYVNNVRAGARPLNQPLADLAEYLGTMQVVQIADRTAGDVARHEVIQTETTPVFPEGIAASPDGSLLVTVNMQTSALPPSNPLFSPTSTISLWTRDEASGLLTKVGDTPFEAILPEGVDFDPTSNRLAVAVYHASDADRTTGNRSGQPRSILIDYTDHDGSPALIATNHGAEFDPAWIRNLRANPDATIVRNRRRQAVRARFLEGDEWERAWQAAVAAYAGYDDYRAKLSRPIPIVSLDAS